jgi:polysaccharide biosynthesis/export protein
MEAIMKIIGFLLIELIAGLSLAQQMPSGIELTDLDSVESRNVPRIENGSGSAADDEYVLGSGDRIVVNIAEADLRPADSVLVDVNGCIRIPMAGRIKVAGLTVSQVEGQLVDRLSKYFLKPDVSVTIAEYGSQPVSVIGEVKNPGIRQVQGRKTLIEVLSLTGGLQDSAGSTAKITRRAEWGDIPLPSASQDSTGRFMVASVNLKSLLEAKNPQDNILVRPYDVISVPKADMVYVIGQVMKSGAFPINEREKISALQALSMAGGLDRMAKPNEARILRQQQDSTNRKEIAINLRKIISGEFPDIPMEPEDILFVPDNTPKRAAVRSMEAILQMVTGVVVWRH